MRFGALHRLGKYWVTGCLLSSSADLNLDSPAAGSPVRGIEVHYHNWLFSHFDRKCRNKRFIQN